MCKIESVSDLQKWLFDLPTEQFLYRGQRESIWPLESSLTRVIDKNSSLKNAHIECEKFCIKSFKTSAHLYDHKFDAYRDASDLSILAYAQHYGSPTKLLDFTSSKYLAIFFAFDGFDLSNKEKFVRVWYFSRKDFNKKTDDILRTKHKKACKCLAIDSVESYIDLILPNKYDCLFLVLPELESQRINAQQGWFLCPGIIDNSIDYYYKAEYKNIIEYVDISKTLHKDVFTYLYNMNITHKSVYGGIDGFGKDIGVEFMNL